MLNFHRVKSNKLYKVYWLDPVTYTDEKLFKPLTKRTNYGYVKFRKDLVYVISADTDEDTDYDYTVIPKSLIYKIEPDER